MFRKLLLPTLAIALLSGCATGYNYRSGNGDYYYGQPSVNYRYSGGYGYGGSIGYGYGQGYYLDVFGRSVYGYPYGYYDGRYPYGHGPRPRPPHGPGQGGGHDGGGPPQHGGPQPGNRPPWRDIGRTGDRNDAVPGQFRRFAQPGIQPRMQQSAPRMPSAPMMRGSSESRHPSSGGMRGGGGGARSHGRSGRPSGGH